MVNKKVCMLGGFAVGWFLGCGVGVAIIVVAPAGGGDEGENEECGHQPPECA